jgi:hypothetical protein
MFEMPLIAGLSRSGRLEDHFVHQCGKDRVVSFIWELANAAR